MLARIAPRNWMLTLLPATALVALPIVWPMLALAVQPQLQTAPHFGMVGLALGQTARLNVVNTLPIDEIPIHYCKIRITYVDPSGSKFKHPDGREIEGVFSVRPGEAAFFDLQAGQVVQNGRRLQIRAALEFQRDGSVPDPCRSIVPTLEIFDIFTGRTSVLHVPPATSQAADDDRER